MNPDLTALYKKQYETLTERLAKMDQARAGATPEALGRVSLAGRVEGENPMARINAGVDIGNINSTAQMNSMKLQMEALDSLSKQLQTTETPDSLSQADLQKEYLKGNPKIKVDPATGKLSINYGEGEKVDTTNTPESKEAATKLRTEYTNQSKTNGFVEVKNQYDKIKNASDSAQGDLSLIFAYMKILDPNSTVREGEFANAQNTTGIPGQVLNAYNKAIKGNRLNAEQRAGFKNEAAQVYNSHVRTQKQMYDFYKKQAEEYGVDPEDVVGMFGDIKEEEIKVTPKKKGFGSKALDFIWDNTVGGAVNTGKDILSGLTAPGKLNALNPMEAQASQLEQQAMSNPNMQARMSALKRANELRSGVSQGATDISKSFSEDINVPYFPRAVEAASQAVGTASVAKGVVGAAKSLPKAAGSVTKFVSNKEGFTKAVEKAGKLNTKEVIKAGEKFIKNEPNAAELWKTVKPTIGQKTKTSDLLDKMFDVWKKAYNAKGDVKGNAEAQLYSKLYGAARKVVADQAPEVSKKIAWNRLVHHQLPQATKDISWLLAKLGLAKGILN